MGFCLSKGEDDMVNDEINDIIKRDKKRSQMEVKMLLLGKYIASVEDFSILTCW
jgi:hypothetical protein